MQIVALQEDVKHVRQVVQRQDHVRVKKRQEHVRVKQRLKRLSQELNRNQEQLNKVQHLQVVRDVPQVVLNEHSKLDSNWEQLIPASFYYD